MGVLKGIGYLVAALIVLAALFMSVTVLAVTAVVGGAVLSLIGMTVFTAQGLKAFFEKP